MAKQRSSFDQQVLVKGAQYTRGFQDAQPREGYHPHSQANGPFVRLYHEGFSDGQTARKSLRKKQDEFEFKHIVPGEDGDDSVALVRHLREVTADTDVRIAEGTAMYKIQCEAIEDFLVKCADAKQEAQIDRAVAKRLAELGISPPDTKRPSGGEEPSNG